MVSIHVSEIAVAGFEWFGTVSTLYGFRTVNFQVFF